LPDEPVNHDKSKGPCPCGLAKKLGVLTDLMKELSDPYFKGTLAENINFAPVSEDMVRKAKFEHYLRQVYWLHQTTMIMHRKKRQSPIPFVLKYKDTNTMPFIRTMTNMLENYKETDAQQIRNIVTKFTRNLDAIQKDFGELAEGPNALMLQNTV